MTRFAPSGPLRGSLRPPSDKSISHRAALIAAMGEGEVEVADYLDAADTRSTLAAVEAVGADVELFDPGMGGLVVKIRGVGLRGAGPAFIDVGNAGTLLRLMPGWLAGQPGESWTLDGDDSIRRRPVDRIAEPLRQMGADLGAREDRLPPLEVRGAPLHGITYELPVASAQVKSCALFAGLLAEGDTTIVESHPSRDHTERMLAAAGAEVRVEPHGDGHAITVGPAERLEPGTVAVPADISSAAFFLVAATLVAGGEVTLYDVGVNPTRTGVLAILERMGASVEVEQRAEFGGESTATLRVRSAPLHATEVGGTEVPLAIDELPLVALAACFAEGTTTIRDAAELRRKESDRVETVTAALRAIGGEVEATEDGMVVTGTGGLRGGTVESHGDHRIAMLGAVAGLASREGVEVVGMDAAAVSYPGFEADLASLHGSRGGGRPAASTSATTPTAPSGARLYALQLMVIAIDGPAGAGKSSVARAVAAELGFTYLDSGAMYRCVALAALERRLDLDDGALLGDLARGLEIALDGQQVLLGGEDVSAAIRAPGVTAAASRVSVHPQVREAMVTRQRALIAAADFVAEGRDIGTVVSPEAPLKVFLTASDEERARRRAAETGEDFESVLDAQRRRDARDTEREHGALRAAEDAVELDTTGLSLEEVVGRVVAMARERGLA